MGQKRQALRKNAHRDSMEFKKIYKKSMKEIPTVGGYFSPTTVKQEHLKNRFYNAADRADVSQEKLRWYKKGK